jgi:hypothetical protein
MKMDPAKSFEAEQLFVDLDSPSLRGLAYVLRRQELWPKEFAWFYLDCTRCAMGLAYRLWRLKIPGNASAIFDGTTDIFSMRPKDAADIFLNAGVRRDGHPLCVTPDMVADDIDAYLARQAAA